MHLTEHFSPHFSTLFSNQLIWGLCYHNQGWRRISWGEGESNIKYSPHSWWLPDTTNNILKVFIEMDDIVFRWVWKQWWVAKEWRLRFATRPPGFCWWGFAQRLYREVHRINTITDKLKFLSGLTDIVPTRISCITCGLCLLLVRDRQWLNNFYFRNTYKLWRWGGKMLLVKCVCTHVFAHTLLIRDNEHMKINCNYNCNTNPWTRCGWGKGRR